jgi:hypothetical protein
MNVHNVSDDRQIEIHKVEPLASAPNRLKVKIATAKLKMCKSPGSDKTPTEVKH